MKQAITKPLTTKFPNTLTPLPTVFGGGVSGTGEATIPWLGSLNSAGRQHDNYT